MHLLRPVCVSFNMSVAILHMHIHNFFCKYIPANQASRKCLSCGSPLRIVQGCSQVAWPALCCEECCSKWPQSSFLPCTCVFSKCYKTCTFFVNKLQKVLQTVLQQVAMVFFSTLYLVFSYVRKLFLFVRKLKTVQDNNKLTIHSTPFLARPHQCAKDPCLPSRE